MKHTSLTFALFFLVSCILLSANGKRWNTNKDSIVVDAQYFEENDQFQSDGVAEKPECFTSDGEPGECVTLIQCHPIFSEKGRLRNVGLALALTYAQTEDVCIKNSLEVGTETKSSAEKESQIGNKVICCSKERIKHESRTDLETYTTTEPTGLPANDANADDLPHETTMQPLVNVADDVVIVESGGFENSYTDNDEVTPDTTEYPATTASETVTVDNMQPSTSVEVSSPDSSVNSEETLEYFLEQHPPSSACPSKESYGPWPVFRTYPWLATIQVRAKTGPTCSGSLITESHVLTAAACIHRFNSRDVARMQIRIGFSKTSTNDTFNDYYVQRNASKIIFHKRFHEQSKMDNNIALIKLDEPVEFDDANIAAIGIFNGINGFDLGNCTAAEAGWIKFGNRRVTGISDGVIHYTEPPMSNFHLRESLGRILSNEDCHAQLNSQINDRMLCGKPTNFEEPNVSTDFFRWNDGGPLVVKVGDVLQQIGIKSWSYEGQIYPVVYTRVDSYLDWVRNNLKM